MPHIPRCINYDHCKGTAVNGGKECQYCIEAREADERQMADRWKYAGFPKSTDNTRRGYKKGGTR